MTHLAALLALPMMMGDLDAEGATQRARAFAEKMQFDQSLVPTGTFLETDPKRPAVWHVGFKLGSIDGGHVFEDVDLNGNVVFLSGDSGADVQIAPYAAHDPQTIAQARTIMSQITDGRAFDPDPVMGTGSEFVLAHFSLLANGLKIFSVNPEYAYLIGFDPAGKEHRWFALPPALPTLSSPSPDIDSQGAIDAAINACRPDSTLLSNQEQILDLIGSAKLGYYMVPNESAARLVWSVDLSVMRQVGDMQVPMMWRTVYVDAHYQTIFKQGPLAREIEIIVPGRNP